MIKLWPLDKIYLFCFCDLNYFFFFTCTWYWSILLYFPFEILTFCLTVIHHALSEFHLCDWLLRLIGLITKKENCCIFFSPVFYNFCEFSHHNDLFKLKMTTFSSYVVFYCFRLNACNKLWKDFSFFLLALCPIHIHYKYRVDVVDT